MANDQWDAFVPASAPSDITPPAPAPSSSADWAAFVPANQPTANGRTVPSAPVAGPTVAGPTADDAASALRPGEVVWCKITATGAHLGSGTPVQVVNISHADTLGWRRVSVVDNELLTVELLPLAQGVPPPRVGDEPEVAFPTATSPPPQVTRPAPFAVGSQSALPFGLAPLQLAIGAAAVGWLLFIVTFCGVLMRRAA